MTLEREKVTRPWQQRVLATLPRSWAEKYYKLVTGFYPGLHVEAQLEARLIKGTTGQVIDYGVISHRLVTTDFRDAIVSSLAGGGDLATFDNFSFHDSGEGATAESNSQTALVTPTGVARTDGTQVDAAPIYRSVGTITYDNTYAITEHGLFDATSNGNLMDRSVFSAINVENTDQIEFTYEITFTAES